MLLTDGQQFLDRAWTETFLVHFSDDVVGRHVTTEVEQLGFQLHLAAPLQWETLGGDVAVRPVVLAGRDHLFERQAVVDHDAERLRGKPEEFPEFITIDLTESIRSGLTEVGQKSGIGHGANAFFGYPLLG